ncbi:MAG: FemAB family XrtA/PEP-CTERM system-associated protein [Candidatus Korobacteraceae bacterium]
MAVVRSPAVAPELESGVVTIKDFCSQIADEWDLFIASNPQATPFHSTAWMRSLQKTFDYENRSFYSERNGKVTGVLPLFMVSNWIIGRCLISTPFADYGGVCAEDEESEDALVARAVEMGVAEKVDFLELRHRTAKSRPEFYVKDLYVSFTTELASEPNAQLKALPKDTRYMIRKGEKAGLQLRSGVDQLPEFYSLFILNWRRLGSPVFSPQWLETLVHEFQDAAILDMAYVSGRPVVGVLSLLFRNTLYPHYSGAAPNANPLAANNFIYWELMKNAINRGVRWFDFGRSKKNTGAYQFKSTWNMQVDSLQYQIRMIERKDPPNFTPANPKFALAANLWSRMPLQATTWLGPHIVRWFP